MITGVWRGKINRQKCEVKIIQNGDNLTGTSYYYESVGNYRRYSIKGYFDATTNEAVWWDDELLEEKSDRLSSPGKIPLLSRADFNCPGGAKTMLDGKASKVDNENEKAGDVDLDKTTQSNFADEWDFVIENYIVGANDPDIIDSIAALVSVKPVIEEEVKKIPEENPIVITGPPVVTKTAEQTISKPEPVKEEPKIIEQTDPIKPLTIGEKAPFKSPPVKETLKTLTIEDKFISRKKVFATEIPVSGDSLELRFYDNAQIDGDSISLFLNDKLIFEHIRLTEKAYIIKLPVSALRPSNELIMVA
jgi:hypothetical protein